MGLCLFLVKVNLCEEEEMQNCASKVKHHSTKGELETTLPLNNLEKLMISKPSNAYEFGQTLNVVNANKDISACAELLMMIEPKDLPALLSNKLEGDIFVIIIQALQLDVFCQDPGLAYQHLFYLGKAERFKVSNLCATSLSVNGKEVNEMQATIHTKSAFSQIQLRSNNKNVFSFSDGANPSQ